jgi:hypothetical protein
MPKWTVVIEGRELPARPLVLEAAGVQPNDPTNSHQAIALLTQQGFEVRYQGKQIDSKREAQPVTDEYIRSIRGSCKGGDSLVEALQHERRSEK